MEPTPEALYTAQYSAPQEGSRQGTGYYADGTVNGYYAKKPEQIDLEALLPQIVKVIEDAGLEVSEETIGQAQWLIEKGIPLDEEDDFETLNGFLISLIDKIPSDDEVFSTTAYGYLFEILSVENKMIQKVHVIKLPEEKASEVELADGTCQNEE